MMARDTHSEATVTTVGIHSLRTQIATTLIGSTASHSTA
jgi:hypothetical protein